MYGGPPKWEKAIMEELALQESFWLRLLLPDKFFKSGYDALLRAARKLEDEGLIHINRYICGQNSTGEGRIAVRRIGTYKPEGKNVGKVLNRNLTHTKKDEEK